MDQRQADVRLGRFLSLVLRHKPEAAGISLDEHGWADVGDLLSGVQKTGRPISMDTLERIVRENNKMRYCFNEDHTKIRANQGHSINVDVELQRKAPPAILYHGTARKYLRSILKEGIQKRNRQYVHLSEEYETAVSVGERHGEPVVLTLDSYAMSADGIAFFLSNNGVWLCDFVPSKYIMGTGASQNGE